MDLQEVFKNMNQSERMKQLNQMVSLDPLSKQWICPVCNTSTSRKDSVIDHIERKHVQLLSYPCKYCDSSFTSSGQKRSHISIKHQRQNKMAKIFTV